MPKFDCLQELLGLQINDLDETTIVTTGQTTILELCECAGKIIIKLLRIHLEKQLVCSQIPDDDAIVEGSDGEFFVTKEAYSINFSFFDERLQDEIWIGLVI